MIIITRHKLEQIADEKYKQFSLTLALGTTNILGVRVPELRKIAKEIVKDNWEIYLNADDVIYHEELMLQGMIIGYLQKTWKEKEELIRSFIPKIDNWAVCDTFCSGLKFKEKERKSVYEFIIPYLYSDKSYEIRFGIVMMLGYFVKSEFINDAFTAFDKIKNDDYYVRMAVAWAISYFFIKFPDETMLYLKDNKLDNWTYNKAIQKIIESRRVDDDTKNTLKVMRRKSLRL